MSRPISIPLNDMSTLSILSRFAPLFEVMSPKARLVLSAMAQGETILKRRPCKTAVEQVALELLRRGEAAEWRTRTRAMRGPIGS